jgi:hypothetical protein
MCTSGIMFLTSVFDSLINTIVATLIKIFCNEADVFAGEAARKDKNSLKRGKTSMRLQTPYERLPMDGSAGL